MKICSVCRRCYDDHVANCTDEDHGSLVETKQGDCLIVKGYKIDSQIESDSPVKLYKATHLSSEKKVLIKFLKIDSAVFPADELQAELKAVSGINHPNLARVFEFGRTGDAEFYAVLEDISGHNLRDYLENKSPLKERYAINIARQIAESLEVLHDAGAVHRAINPSNIYFTSADDTDFSVKLQNYDFGGIEQKIVADGANGIDAKAEIFRYFSPEQFTDEKPDFKSDLYSLAVVFYEMLLGHSPYHSLNPQAIANFIFNESDVEKLHFDLRALLAYTLKQSFQHRLNLRPPTTNNLARQYRHLELIATPPSIGMQEKAANRGKPKQTVNISQPDKTFAAEKQIAKPVIIEPEILAEENNISPVDPAPEISAAENILVLQNAETDLIESEVFETAAETEPEIVSAESVEIEEPANRISEEINKFGEQNSVYEFGNFDTTDLAEFEMAFENIHITNKDDEEPEISLSEVFEYEEPEFVEEEPNAKPENERQAMNSFISYAAPRSSSFNKNYVYIAGSIVLFIFGGLIAMSFWQSKGNKNSAQTAPQKNTKPLSAEKKEPIVEPEKIKETVEITEEPANLPQFDGRQTDEISGVEQVAAKPDFNKSVRNETAVKTENKPAPVVKEKVANAPNENKSLKTPPVKKQEKNQTVNIEDIRRTTVIIVGKTKPTVKKVDATTRPRVVTASPSGN